MTTKKRRGGSRAMSVAELLAAKTRAAGDDEPGGDESPEQEEWTGEAQAELPTLSSLEEGLNPEQLEVVRHDAGPCRVLSCAGSGKTESLGRRVARMVKGGADPRRILVLTFSKKGAGEMSARIAKKFGVAGVQASTWHSFSLRVLREDRTEQGSWTVEGERKGRGPGTSTNPKMVLKDVVGWKGMDWKGVDIGALVGFIGRCKANLHAPDSDEALASATATFGWQANRALEAFQKYNDALAEKGLLTFDDFMVFAAAHLQSDECVRASWASRFDHVIEDEQQDSNRAQKTIAELIARDHRNYMVIGDCFQSIYAFRGSSPAFLAKFEEEWPGARTIVLPRNYRSGRSIIAAANAIVMKGRVEGLASPTPMIGERAAEGKVRVLCAESLDDEAEDVVGAIHTSTAVDGTTWSDHTILFRTNAQSRALEEALLSLRVPYQVVGGMSFYERKEVRDLLAYLRLAASVGSADDIRRSINTPFRFLGTAFVERVMDAVEGRDLDAVDWAVVVERVAQGAGIQGRQKASAAEWASMLRGMRAAIQRGVATDERVASEAELLEARPSSLLERVVRETKYIDYLNREEGGETTEESGAANVREMVRVAERFKTAGELLSYIDETIREGRAMREDKQAGGRRVLLMSIHRSKGLEWPHVYVVGMNEMVLPHAKGDPEEERRLAYVATTRARDSLTLSYVRRIATRAGIRDVHPSRFLLDTGLHLDSPGLGMPSAPLAKNPLQA